MDKVLGQDFLYSLNCNPLANSSFLEEQTVYSGFDFGIYGVGNMIYAGLMDAVWSQPQSANPTPEPPLKKTTWIRYCWVLFLILQPISQKSPIPLPSKTFERTHGKILICRSLVSISVVYRRMESSPCVDTECSPTAYQHSCSKQPPYFWLFKIILCVFDNVILFIICI